MLRLRLSRRLGALFLALIVTVSATFGTYLYLLHRSQGTPYITHPLSFYADPFAPVHDPARRAYATTLYDEGYVPGALVLGRSLIKHGMLAQDVARTMLLLYIPTRISPASLALLQSAGWTLRPVERIAPPPSRMPGDIFRDQYTKLRLYELEDECDSVFYMDADMLVVRPFPEVWDLAVPFAAVRDVRMRAGWIQTFNAGALLLRPSRKLLANMLELAPTFAYDPGFAEQALLNAYWKRDLTVLPYIYNAQLTIRRVFPLDWVAFSRDIRLIHYTSHKPWTSGGARDVSEQRQMWWDAWEEMNRERVGRGLQRIANP